MGLAHKGSILPIKHCVPVDKNTTFLAHYDITEEESLFGIKPIGYRYALEFDGVDDYVRITGPSSSNNAAVTWEAWIYPTNVSVDQMFIGNETNTANYFRITNSKIFVSFYINGVQKTLSGVTTLVNGKWYHVAAVYTGNEIRLYLNGNLETTLTGLSGTVNAFHGDINFGFWRTGDKRPFKGKINEIRFWSFAKTDTQIKQEMYKELNGNESGLVGYWKLNEGSGTIVYDYTNNKNNGTINGAIWSNGQVIVTLRPFEGKYGGGIAIEENTENAIGNGDLANGAMPDTENGSVGTYHTVVPTPFPNPINSDYVLKFSPTGGTSAEMELHPKPGYVFPGAGKYTISCYIWVSDDWDGSQQFLHSRWWNGGNVIGTTHGGFPTKRNTWERISATFDTGSTVPTDFAWYFGYPQQSTKGVVYATGFQVEYKPFATSFVKGKRDRGLLEYPTAGILNPNAGTINVWVNVRDDLPDNAWRMIFVTKDKGRLNGTETNQIRMGFVNNWSTWHWKMTGPTGGAFYQTLIVTKGWHMFTITWDKTMGIKYYYDGQLKYSTTDTTLIPSQFYPTFWLGTWLETDNLANHIIDEFRIDNVARTEEEILQWYYSQAPFFPKGIHRIYS